MGKKNKYTYPPLLILFITVGLLFQGCKEDVFNPEKVKATYQDRFPVKDIDPEMDWKTTRAVQVDVAVNLDADTDYSIRIYDDNPLTENSAAHLLSEGTANNKMAFLSTMDCPIDVTDVYVCLTDASNRSVVKLCSIEDGNLQTLFGLSPSTRAATRAGNNGITIYTPDRTEAEIKVLAATAKELNEKVVIKKGDVYKISKGTTYQGKITNHGINNGTATIIVEGTWEPKGNMSKINTGIDLIVAGDGKIILPKDGNRNNEKALYLVGSSRFIVFQGGSIVGETTGTGCIYLSNASGGRFNYNAGTIQVHTLEMSVANGTFYNSGKIDANELIINNNGSKLINQGEANLVTVPHSNCLIENGCRLTVSQDFYGSLVLGDNCSATIGNYAPNGNWGGKYITMGSNSMLTINGTAKLAGIKVTGPQNGNALIKIGTLTDLNGFKHENGHIYYEVQTDQITDVWMRKTFLHYLLNTNGTLSKWGEAPIHIPAGDCTGKGNIPASGTGTSTTDEAITYTYAFEDNFPMVGDYDFNDIVLDVKTSYKREKQSNAIKYIQLDVTLVAAGAGHTLGAGLRIVNIPKSAIRSIRTGGDDRRFQETLTSPRTGKLFFAYNPSTHMENGDNDIVIPLFNDEHQVFGVEQGTHVNTASTAGLHADGKKAYTYEIIIELADQTKQSPLFSKDNLDFFICYQYQQMPKRVEVHLYEFWKNKTTAGGMAMDTNLDLAGNNTWAICVPNFRYPKELVNISISSNPSAGAYPLFLNWAKNRNANTDWYLSPNENKVYR
ncbi:LruC domain-containing protein [Bacteroides zoogleoformans]|uniref:LruC domain-containing protein n=1 Tax=Bacteroides zoogleoformans TaxID=28119 RepID=A0ABM6T5Q4_9BACE|nr:LruC domain-containing protein [Bacteroides zoogleoformans]AVM52039.1 LruC domain-containing protein [Bacteroides zoogleoformans]TWJ13970.1 LruC domain-containing protein [Bacteroides zoogleoformans]